MIIPIENRKSGLHSLDRSPSRLQISSTKLCPHLFMQKAETENLKRKIWNEKLKWTAEMKNRNEESK